MKDGASRVAEQCLGRGAAGKLPAREPPSAAAAALAGGSPAVLPLLLRQLTKTDDSRPFLLAVREAGSWWLPSTCTDKNLSEGTPCRHEHCLYSCLATPVLL